MKKEWTYKKLGEVCGKPSNIKWDEVPKDRMFHYMDLTSVDRETLTINAPQVINSKDAPSRAKQIVRFADVLFATTRPTLKRICIIPKEYDNQICSTGFCILRPNTNILSEWIFYLLLNDNFYNYVEPLQTGANYPAVTDKVIKDYKIPVPPLSEQQAIVSRLDAAFAKIEAVKANAEKQLNDAKALFQKELSKAMTPKEGWEEKKLPDISENLDSLRRPVTKKNREVGKYPYYGASGIVDYVDDYLFDEKLLCISEDGANLLMRTYPIAFSISGKVWVNNHAHVLRFTDEITQRYVELFFKILDIEEYITGAAQPKLTQKALNNITINIPPDIVTQQAIVSHLDTLSEKLKTVEEKQKAIMAECDAMKQALLREVFG